jgi:hypothetical protein
MQKRQGVVLALFDVNEHGIDHVVVYGGASGLVTDYLGSRDPGPFDTRQETLEWLLRTVSVWSPPLHR